MTRFVRVTMSPHIVINSLKIAAVVGTLLNMVNQGESIAWGHLLLNYLVPYCVASYSAARNEIEPKDNDEC